MNSDASLDILAGGLGALEREMPTFVRWTEDDVDTAQFSNFFLLLAGLSLGKKCTWGNCLASKRVPK